MATRPKFSEAEVLEQYRVALENAKDQPEIASIMAEFGYNAKEIAQGKSLLQETRTAYDANKTEDDETAESYLKWSDLRENLADRYALDRKKAKVVFRNDALLRDKLGVSGTLPQAYVKWLETTKKFYTESISDPDIQKKLVRLKINADYLSETSEMITALESARSEYLREVGESQNATNVKDKAFVEMDDWMSEFYAVAKIALEDKPQLLESLGKLVRS